MKSIINWVCYISVILLVGEILVYMYNDIKNIYYKSEGKVRSKTKQNTGYSRESKIAK